MSNPRAPPAARAIEVEPDISIRDGRGRRRLPVTEVDGVHRGDEADVVPSAFRKLVLPRARRIGGSERAEAVRVTEAVAIMHGEHARAAAGRMAATSPIFWKAAIRRDRIREPWSSASS